MLAKKIFSNLVINRPFNRVLKVSLGLPLMSLLLFIPSLCLAGGPEVPIASSAKQALAEGTWTTDFEAAKALGKESKLPVLVLFTGSDWCPPCKDLTKSILLNPVFLEAIKGKYILTYLDFPKNNYLGEEILAQHRDLFKQYQLRGYPTLLCLDEQGEVLGKLVGYLRDMDVDTYLRRMRSEFRP